MNSIEAQINVNRLARLETVEELVLILTDLISARIENVPALSEDAMRERDGLVTWLRDTQAKLKQLREEGGA